MFIGLCVMNLMRLKLSILCGIIIVIAVNGESWNTSVATMEQTDVNREVRKTKSPLPGETMGGLKGCESFQPGNENEKEFYSPNYPLNYSSNTTCTKIIRAQNKTQQIVLDFRDKFDLEPSENCKYDFLEIRDGMHGYSPLIGVFCGEGFPKEIITSSGPNMWLKFHSDEHIEYGGFRAVYKFIERAETGEPQEDEPCYINITGQESASISDENINKSIWNNGKNFGVDCMYYISVDETKQVSLQWDVFNLQYPNDCEKNYMDIFGKETDSRINCFCGAAAETVVSKDNIMQIRLVASKNVTINFKAHFTAFRSSSNCTEAEFNCQDNTCIDINLKCDSVNNCPTGSDEDKEDCKKEETLWHHLLDSDIMIILVIFFVTIFGMCCTLLFNIIRKLIHDYRVIKENIAQSRESQLDQLGRKTPTMILTPVLTVLPNFPDNIVHHITNTDQATTSESCDSSAMPATEARNLHHQSSDDCYVPTEGTFRNLMRRETTPFQDCRRVNGGPTFRLTPMSRHKQRSSVYDEDDDDGGFMSRNGTNDDSSEYTPPEMVDNECQTRESLFQTTSPFSSLINKSSSRSPSPTPLSPVINLVTLPRKSLKNQQPYSNVSATPPSPPIGFTTFGYKNYQKPQESARTESPFQPSQQQHRFKAEATIELLNQKKDRHNEDMRNNRAYSFQSSKSAPDVIVTH